MANANCLSEGALLTRYLKQEPGGGGLLARVSFVAGYIDLVLKALNGLRFWLKCSLLLRACVHLPVLRVVLLQA